MPSQAHVTLEYETLVADYWQSLTTVLRGFQSAPGVEFLEAWVPDDDHAQSLLAIVEAAKEGGLSAITLLIGKRTAATLDRSAWSAAAGAHGAVDITPQDGGLKVQVVFERSNDELPIAPSYRRQVSHVLRSTVHEGELKPQPGLEYLEVTVEGVTIAALVDPASHTIQQIAYRGCCSEAQRGVLEVVCAYARGKPMQECSDHAVIFAEHRLRDRTMPPPVPGVILPQNADAAFGVPLQLVRGLLAQWRLASRISSCENRYDPPVSASWAALTDAQRLETVRAMIAEHPLGEGVSGFRLEGVHRVVLQWSLKLDQATRRTRLLQLEQDFKTVLEPTIEVYLEPKADQNTVRQGPGGRE